MSRIHGISQLLELVLLLSVTMAFKGMKTEGIFVNVFFLVYFCQLPELSKSEITEQTDNADIAGSQDVENDFDAFHD